MIFPGPIFERRYNARKVQAAGAGRMGEVNQFTPAWLQAALAEHSFCCEQAVNLSKRIRAYGGAQAAVNAIQRLS